MIAVLIGLSPVLAFGAFALVTHVRANRLTILDMTADTPESKRSKRRVPVDAVVLHQMSFSRGSDPTRYRKVTAHFIVLPDGTVAQLHPMSARLSASDGFNSRSVAIEFAGNLQSAKGTWWKPDVYGRDVLTPAQAESGRLLLRRLRAAGIRQVYAHRQSSASRGNDPGPEIWAAVGQWGIDVLGMSDGGHDYAIDSGSPVPSAWRTYSVHT
ncbi:N-acetylmuramoyl-L-alanine amidase, family 2 [Plesiocystis pacifica SIR-1]|uniref:N-acetylmuramoyl-L-alanine amidase, family 2 n=1 Tax=Plesiocystis pacifica SIR-1 TaxID=391625 RepID=A6G6S6_9BACT|nr:N-acetylmuramoyl-L-alanine amidase [Plesiocystis pacifica]EDM78379.1 N-acetylmuramoyl-L-alanine amidase, family 2 [Plesiocystis pacifica SIR-1]